MIKIEKPISKKILVSAIVLSMQLNTVAYATTTVVPDKAQGKNPGVMEVANGITVVNIRTPNDKGLSHNQYTNLQVGKEGLIFNNSSSMSKTELAGYINGNQYLAGPVAAKVILNEVTGKLPTNLNGYMEIAGKKADLVIANPNGIVGNNFGYINTSRAVLTTGKPLMALDGRLDGFSVNSGNITIEGLGLDAKTATKAEIYARAARINAGIWVQELNIATGSNKIDYATGNVKEVINNEDRGVSLDVAALGGMYVGRIKLVGTAKGLGVNMEGEAYTYDGVAEITQEGDVVIRHKVVTATGLNVDTKGSFSNEGTIQSDGNTSIAAGKDITNTGTIYGETSTTLNAKENITNTGTLQGGNNTEVNAEKDINNTGLVNGTNTSLTALNLINNTNTDKIYGDKVTLKANTLNNLAGISAHVIAAREDMSLEANTINNKEHGVLTAERDLSLKADTINNNSATIEAGRNLNIEANTLNNTNEHFATEVQVVKEEDFVEYQGGGATNRYSAKRAEAGGYTFDDQTIWW